MTLLNPLTLWDVGFRAELRGHLQPDPLRHAHDANASRRPCRRAPAGRRRPHADRLPQRRADRHPGRHGADPAADRLLLRPRLDRLAADQPAGAAGAAVRHDLGRPGDDRWGCSANRCTRRWRLCSGPWPASWPPSPGWRCTGPSPWCRRWRRCPSPRSTSTWGVPGCGAYFGLIGLLTLASRPSLPLVGTGLQRLKGALSSSRLTTLAASLLLVTGSLLLLALRSQPDGRLHVHFLDMERGEAVLIVTARRPAGVDRRRLQPHGAAGRAGPAHALLRPQPGAGGADPSPATSASAGWWDCRSATQIEQVLQAPFPYPSTAYESWLRTVARQRAYRLPRPRPARACCWATASRWTCCTPARTPR